MEEESFHGRPTLPTLTENVSPIPIPKSIGPYHIERVIEKGGMSILYFGTHQKSGESAAIKVLSKKYLSHEEVVDRFLKEAEIISMTNHPNIVKLFGHDTWEGGLYIAMEYVKGTSLRKYLLQQPISLKKALAWIIDIAYALCHLHTHGVIHRDLKPENILVTESGNIKVIDFGIAQLIEQQKDPNLLSARKVIGTPIYISPEQRHHPENVSYPSDIYSLGIIAYELVLGKLSQGKIHLSLMPKGFQPILRKTLNPDPKERYQTCVDLIEDLSNYLNSKDLEKETAFHDQLSEFSEEFRHLQKTLLSSPPEKWEKSIDIGIETQQGMGLLNLWYEFLDLSDGSYTVLFGEPAAKGAEGVIATHTLRATLNAFKSQSENITELIQSVNNALFSDPLGSSCMLTALTFYPGQKKCAALSLGSQSLYYKNSKAKTWEKHSAKHPSLGLEFNPEWIPALFPWEEGDALLLHTFAATINPDKISHTLSADKIATLLLHTRESTKKPAIPSRPVCVMCLKCLG